MAGPTARLAYFHLPPTGPQPSLGKQRLWLYYGVIRAAPQACIAFEAR